MIRGTRIGWTASTLLVLFAGAANADEQGLIQVSDSPASSATKTPSAGTPDKPKDAAPGNGTGTTAAGAARDSTCDAGHEGAGRCHLCGFLSGIVTYNPAAGFRPPETVPIEREAVMYYNYWPAKLYGQPGYRLAPSFPMVYMPTDTTQLGVYYARVPQWLPNPRMYPRPPRPDQWSRRVVMADHTGNGAGAGCQPASGATPTPDTMGTPVSPPTNAAPAPQQTMPPAPKMLPAPAPGPAAQAPSPQGI